MCNILVPVVADPQVAALSPNKVCSSQLDVVADVVPHAAQPVFKTRHSLEPPNVGDSGHSSLLPSRSGSEEKKKTCMWPWRSMCCPADCTALSVLAGGLNVQHIGACSC